MNIASLVGQWDFLPGQITILAGQEVRILEPNARRYAFGIAVPLTSNLFLRPLGTMLAGPGIFCGNGEFRWFDLHTHGVLVSSGWQMINSDAVPWTVSVWEVVQTANQS